MGAQTALVTAKDEAARAAIADRGVLPVYAAEKPQAIVPVALRELWIATVVGAPAVVLLSEASVEVHTRDEKRAAAHGTPGETACVQ